MAARVALQPAQPPLERGARARVRVERRAELGDRRERGARLGPGQERERWCVEGYGLEPRELLAEPREQHRPRPAECLVAHEEVGGGNTRRVATEGERAAEHRGIVLAAPQRLRDGCAGVGRGSRDGELAHEVQALGERGVTGSTHDERVLTLERAAVEAGIEAPVEVDRAAAERLDAADRDLGRPGLGGEPARERGLRVGVLEVERRHVGHGASPPPPTRRARGVAGRPRTAAGGGRWTPGRT